MNLFFELIRRIILERIIPAGRVFNINASLADALAKRSVHWTREEIESYQGNRLKALVKHCFQNVPYYRRVMDERNLTPNDFKRPQDVSKFPILTKQIIRDNGPELRARNYPDSICQFRRSGGTTGEPTKVAICPTARSIEIAMYLRGFSWMGWRPGKPIIQLFGGSLGIGGTSARARLVNWLLNTIFLSAFELRRENVKEYSQTVLKNPGGVLVGYSSAVFNLAELISAENLPTGNLVSIICTAEQMPDAWKARIQEAFKVPCFMYYGCGEIQSVAYESMSAEKYIVCQERVILEVADPKEDVFRDSGNGAFCITDLHNYAMPMIRYQNGDAGTIGYLSGSPSHQRIIELDGRIMDRLITIDGQLICSALPPHMILRSGLRVSKFQLIQFDRRNLLFRYATESGNELDFSEKEIVRGVFRKYLGEGMNVDFAFEGFEISKSGKHRFVINHLLM